MATTFFEHLVYQYSGISIAEIQDLPFTVWMQLRFDAYVSKLNETEDGRELLEKAWILSQTEADREGLANLMKLIGG
ncbi:hypothetical protein EVA_10184 [gut metagenome]|uniref:Uncharacterized protein n=1 Tax=gut metagenome TaxID=749906 RepID=J9CNM0_9ZZZZ